MPQKNEETDKLILSSFIDSDLNLLSKKDLERRNVFRTVDVSWRIGGSNSLKNLQAQIELMIEECGDEEAILTIRAESEWDYGDQVAELISSLTYVKPETDSEYSDRIRETISRKKASLKRKETIRKKREEKEKEENKNREQREREELLELLKKHGVPEEFKNG